MARRKPLNQTLDLAPKATEIKKDDLIKIEIKDRRVICKSCNNDFNTSGLTIYEHEGERVLVFCPACGVCNKIKRDLTIGTKYDRRYRDDEDKG